MNQRIEHIGDTVTLYLGDCRETMQTLPAQSVHCCVTSPPYFGLRDYGVDGQLGLEATPDEYVETLVGVFREVRRVLRDDGTVWLNLGDSYAAGRRGRDDGARRNKRGVFTDGKAKPEHMAGTGKNRNVPPGFKPKDLLGIPWRVAFALRADGWYLRQDIIWYKPNPMPESVTDRCTKAHEYIFLLSKSARYYYDSEAIKEPCSTRIRAREKNNGESAVDTKKRGFGGCCGCGTTRNLRSVWTVKTQSFDGAHFATFPPDLIAPCILAGCPQGGTVLDPFGGSGTTGLVARMFGRLSILCELNPEYETIMRERMKEDIFTAAGGLTAWLT